MFCTSSAVASARSTSGLLGLVTSRSVWQAPLASARTAPATNPPSFREILMYQISPKGGCRSELDLNLASDRAEVGIAESIDAEVEIIPRRHFRIETGVIRPGEQVATDERDLDTARVAVDSDACEHRTRESVAGRQLAELHVRSILHEIAVRHQTVVQAGSVEVERYLLGVRLPRLILVTVTVVLEHPLLREVVDVAPTLAVDQGVQAEALVANVVREPERKVGVHVTDRMLVGSRRVHVLDRRVAVGLAHEEPEGIDLVVGFHGCRGALLQLGEAPHPPYAIDEAKRLARLVVEHVLTLAAGVDAERRAVHTRDFLTRPVGRER